MKYTFFGIIIYLFLILGILCILPCSPVLKLRMNGDGKYRKIRLSGIIITICLLIGIESYFMSINPWWNGEQSEHQHQYELMAESILAGNLFLPCEVSPELKAMDDPYDYNSREQMGVEYHWDHAYKDGHYYMYFGVVPVLVLYLPYRIITGEPLNCYHGTQVFCAGIIIGLFVIFHLLIKIFKGNISYITYLLLGVTSSLICIWGCMNAPALYCTAISSAVCFAIWSLICYLCAVFLDMKYSGRIAFAIFGALFGAFVFGCRPTIGIANIIAIPLCYIFIKRNVKCKKDAAGLLCVFLPYIMVGAGLMLYNYVRFGDVFEFGQRYQLTVTNQQSLGRDTLSIQWVVTSVKNFLFERQKGITQYFPFVKLQGAILNFPILIMGFVTLFFPRSWKRLGQEKIVSVKIGLWISVIVISLLDTIMSPVILERYHMDIYWLLCIDCMLSAVVFSRGNDIHVKIIDSIISLLCIFSLILVFLYYLIPNADNAFGGVFYDTVVVKLYRLLGINRLLF